MITAFLTSHIWLCICAVLGLFLFSTIASYMPAPLPTDSRKYQWVYGVVHTLGLNAKQALDTFIPLFKTIATTPPAEKANAAASGSMKCFTAAMILVVGMCSFITGCNAGQVIQDIVEKAPQIALVSPLVLQLLDPSLPQQTVTNVSTLAAKIASDGGVVTQAVNQFQSLKTMTGDTLSRVNAAVADANQDMTLIVQYVTNAGGSATTLIKVNAWVATMQTLFNDLAADLEKTASPAALYEQLPVFFGPSFMHAMAMSGTVPQFHKHSGKSARQIVKEFKKLIKDSDAKVTLKTPGHAHVAFVPMPWR